MSYDAAIAAGIQAAGSLVQNYMSNKDKKEQSEFEAGNALKLAQLKFQAGLHGEGGGGGGGAAGPTIEDYLRMILANKQKATETQMLANQDLITATTKPLLRG